MCPRITYMLFALALTGACRSTPLDLVYAADVIDAAAGATVGGAGAGGAGAGGAGGGGGGGSAAEGGTCSMVGPGRYVLRSQANGLCLGQGAPTTVFGNPDYPGFLLDFSADCLQPERTWQLLPTPTPNVFSIQNVSPSGSVPVSYFVLDVQMAGTRDGTPVITYGDTGFDNQRFEVRARDTFVSELRPQHHPQSCVRAASGSAEITTCAEADSSQAWLLQRRNCL